MIELDIGLMARFLL